MTQGLVFPPVRHGFGTLAFVASHAGGRPVRIVGRIGGPGRDRTGDLFRAISEVYSKINNLGARTAILSDRKARNIPANWYHEWCHVLLFFLSP